MESKKLFVIGGQDFTNFITVPSYKVNNVERYVSWTNGYHEEIRNPIGKKISGSFTMIFQNNSDWLDFLRTLKHNTEAGGETLASLYVVNEDEVISAYVYIDFEAPDYMPVSYQKENSGIEITITEKTKRRS